MNTTTSLLRALALSLLCAISACGGGGDEEQETNLTTMRTVSNQTANEAGRTSFVITSAGPTVDVPSMVCVNGTLALPQSGEGMTWSASFGLEPPSVGRASGGGEAVISHCAAVMQGLASLSIGIESSVPISKYIAVLEWTASPL